MGELNRMTQFKDKSKNQKNINVGLFSYPVLMASDILLYQSDLVPVGADQKQHLELSRDIAQKFNNDFNCKGFFPLPEPLILKNISRVMSLRDGTKKMSRAVTDSGKEIIYSKDKPGLSNLIDICIALNGSSYKKIEEKYAGKMYSSLKNDIIDLLIDLLSPIQNEYNKIITDKDYLQNVLKQGADNCSYKARKTISKVYRKIGLIKK